MPAITVDLPSELYERLMREAKALGKRPQDRITELVQEHIAPEVVSSPEELARGLAKLHALLDRIPGVQAVSTSKPSETEWWLKLDIALDSPIAWHIVQELGHVLNYISLTERLPTVFMPISPPPYLNGGPKDFLSWAIEARQQLVDASLVAEILEGRLPRPIEDEAVWLGVEDAEVKDEDEGDA